MNTNIKASIILLIMTTLCVWNIEAQTNECGLVISAEDSVQIKEFKSTMAASVRAKRIASSNDIRSFPLQHHIVRTSAGSGGLSANVIPQIVSELNSTYINSNIQFYTCGNINYIDSDTYYNFTSSQEYTLRTMYNNPNAINIYYFNSVMSGSMSACGYTYLPTTNINFIAIANICAINGSTVIHEMGHFFGLLHTHDTLYGMENPKRLKLCDSGRFML
jgi:hypothetical protein